MPVPNVQWKTPDDGQRNCPKQVDFLDKNKFGKIGFIKRKPLTVGLCAKPYLLSPGTLLSLVYDFAWREIEI
jgi:hypothetical protein